ncbi:MAG: hypothetical protein GXP24_12390 [Planctomycetes bacterium]|nr:hypothetical protein [Planctomycetota bacterium]
MNFLGLSFLFALPLIAVPVMIHLYRGRQRDIISWGAMQFLEQATTKGRSIQRLEELLLMLLRIATVLALVLALAQPMLRSTWFGSATDREIVLLLDNSLSMARTVNEVSASDRMIEKALELVEDLSSSDTVHLLLAAGGGQWLTAEGIAADRAGKHQLTTLLEEIEPTLGRAHVLDCLQLAVHLEPQEDPISRRIVLFSDNQSLNWQLQSERSWQQLGAARENSSVPIAIEIVACGFAETELKNLAVMKLEASRQFARPGERVEFSARVENVGETASDGTLVEWLIDEEVFDISELRSLAPQEATRVTAQLQRKEAGNFAVTCRIQAKDQIVLDGQASVVIEVSDQLPILVVHDPETDESTKATDQLFTAALGYESDKVLDWHSVYRPELASVAQLAEIAFSKYRAVVILGSSELPAEAHERLHAYVRGGGGLWVTLGDRVDRETFNRFWHDDGGGLSPILLETLVSVEDTNAPKGSIHPPERDHPATMQLANTTQLDIDQARLSEYWQMVHGGDQVRKAWVLLESGNGSPLVVENLVGEGRVLIQAFPLGLEWSNLPQLKSYVVMIHDWLDYLTAPAMARYNLEPGNVIKASLPANTVVTTAKLLTPSGQQVTLASTASDENESVRYSQTELPGLYRLTFETDGEEASLPFYVARDVEESKWQPLEQEDRTQLFRWAGVQFEGVQAAATATVTNVEPRPRARPIWGALLLALIGLLIGEQILSSYLARQRSGVAVT